MIRRLVNSLTYPDNFVAHLISLLPHSKELWDKPPDDIVVSIKAHIKSRLLANQNDICGYCGLDLGGTSDGQIEHIAPKARYPQFTFERGNLVMACHYCNGFSKKGNHNTIANLAASYSANSFRLVHPYYDDPSFHYEWIAQDKKVIIKGISEKGKYSIRIFKLAEPKMTELRAKKVVADIVIAADITPQINDALIQSAINYK
jgi:uncharacterized protein (TIGR02646 family)